MIKIKTPGQAGGFYFSKTVFLSFFRIVSPYCDLKAVLQTLVK